jgi:hypothetical protein
VSFWNAKGETTLSRFAATTNARRDDARWMESWNLAASTISTCEDLSRSSICGFKYCHVTLAKERFLKRIYLHLASSIHPIEITVMATASIAQPSAPAAGPSSAIASTSTSTSSIQKIEVSLLCSARTAGQLSQASFPMQDALATPAELPPSVQYIDSPFQLQEYLSLLLRKDPHDVERIVRIPEADVSRIFEETPKGKEKEVGASYVDEELHPIDTDVWVYEQLR